MDKNKKYWECHKEVNNVIYRKCSKCQEWKEENLENFYYKNKQKIEMGYTSECRVCMKLRSKKYQQENWDTVRLIQLEWYYANAEKVKKRFKKAREKRKDHDRNYNREYAKNNPEKLKEYQERRQNKNHTISNPEWTACKEYFNNSCAYCGLHQNDHLVLRKNKMINMDLHKEHVVHDGEDDLSNCVPSCKSCNSQKWEYSLDEWYNENNQLFNKDRYNKIIKWLNNDHKLYTEPPKPKRNYNKKSK